MGSVVCVCVCVCGGANTLVYGFSTGMVDKNMTTHYVRTFKASWCGL